MLPNVKGLLDSTVWDLARTQTREMHTALLSTSPEDYEDRSPHDFGFGEICPIDFIESIIADTQKFTKRLLGEDGDLRSFRSPLFGQGRAAHLVIQPDIDEHKTIACGIHAHE